MRDINTYGGVIVITAAILHCAMGTVAALIAQRKGRDLRFWLPIGLIVGTPALIAAWRLEAKLTSLTPPNPDK